MKDQAAITLRRISNPQNPADYLIEQISGPREVISKGRPFQVGDSLTNAQADGLVENRQYQVKFLAAKD